MQSKWVEEQERIVNEFRSKKRGQFPMVVGMICFMVILFVAIGYINSGTMPKENITVMIKTLGIVIAVIGLVLFFSKRQNNKQGCPNLRKTLEKMFTTQDEINQFDDEMNTSPLCWVELDNNDGEYFFTQNYLVFKLGRVPFIDYSIFKLSEIYSTKTVCLRDHASANILVKEYFTNLCDEDCKVLGGVTIKKKNEYEDFISNLQMFVPNVKLGEGR